ncbi:1,6-anhydro-N-acetylmuramyl-L-alanine amidase AmpD [Silvimonas iriomotensis]|nr:1,6-anhydro-N-acetylmuramyl-L-alanine amidase AmpD [Silvimonas iriomotensis]
MNPAFDAAGWYAPARKVPSPNCDARPVDTPVELLVIHNISLPPGEFGGDLVERLFTNTIPADHPLFADLGALRVSAHFLIRRDGQVVQFVSVHERAAHAGVSDWQGRARCNDFSVGIELEGTDHIPFTDAQYAALIPLAQALGQTCPLRAIVGHNDIAPLRKTDPGPCFDWQRVYVALPHLVTG